MTIPSNLFIFADEGRSKAVEKSPVTGCFQRIVDNSDDLRQLRRWKLLFLQPLSLEWSHSGRPGFPLVHLDYGSESCNFNTKSA